MKPATASFFVLLSLTCLAQEKASTPKANLTSAQLQAVGAPKPADAIPEIYKIGPGDMLIVTVWKETALSGSYLVRPDGMISMPLVGDVQASSLTPAQLGNELESGLKKYIQSPGVTVQISQVHSKVIYILGEVTKKGPVDLAPGMTLLQAISSAGGLTDFANAKKIYILRNDSGKQVKIPAHYKEALRGENSLNLALQPGDTIVVP